MKNGYLVKIIPPKGYRVHRLEFTRRQALSVAAFCALIVGLVAAYGVYSLRLAEQKVHDLGAVTSAQQAQLNAMGQRTEALGAQLQRLQVQDQEIRGLMGVDRGAAHPKPRASAGPPPKQTVMRDGAYEQVAARLRGLEAASQRAESESERLRRLAMRVLNVRKIEELARARLIAAIPSINPVPGAEIASTFGWRMDPWPSYHQGVDLDADYGTQVLASAAGTVAFVGWDGGYGLKVDIDHGNGYHTWYAHLSRADVSTGTYVRKAQPIAFVGQTGDATGPHLHYQVMLEGRAIDPAPFLSGVPPKVLASLK